MSVLDRLRARLARPYRTVTPAEATTLLERGAILLDVREDHEWRAGHAPKARHIPLGRLATGQRELPAGRPIVTVCRSGGRSARAAGLLASSGREVANLRGGMSAWAASGLPVVAKGGAPGRVV